MMRPVLRFCVLLLPVALAAACGSPSEPSASTTTTTNTTTNVSVTETFDGTLGSAGTNYHVFHTLPGVFTVTLTSVGPSAPPPPFGLAFGMWDGKTCTLVLSSTEAVATTALTGTASVETDVCLKTWDPTPWDAGLTLNYKLTAVHFAKSS